MSRVIDLAALPTDSGIVFPEGTSLNIDSNTLYIDSANNRIGIGTSSPSRALHLSFTGSNGIRLQATDAGLPRIDFDDTEGSANIIGTANRLQIYTNNAERMRIDSAGNVGIGITNPSELLELKGGGSAQIRIKGSGNVAADGDFGIEVASRALTFNDRYNGGERMRIDSSGNVGIGTSSPSEPLEVIGAAYIGQVNRSKGMYLSSVGSIELIRDDSVAYIDFKTTSAEDFDCRIQTSSNGLNFYVGGNGSAAARLQLASDGGVYLPSSISNGFGKSTFVVEDAANTGEEGGVEIRAFAPRLLLVDRSTGSYTVNMVMDGVNFYWYQNTEANVYTTKGTERFRYGITTGNAYNTTGTWGTISDQKLKENIVDATPKLDEVKQLQVRNFNFIDDDLKQIGFVAQEIEQVFPNIVDTQVNEEDGTETKYVKTTVLIPILTKALQEAITKIETLETRIQALENN